MKPRIKILHYKVIPDKSVDYDNAPEIREETDDFTIKVNRGGGGRAYVYAFFCLVQVLAAHRYHIFLLFVPLGLRWAESHAQLLAKRCGTQSKLFSRPNTAGFGSKRATVVCTVTIFLTISNKTHKRIPVPYLLFPNTIKPQRYESRSGIEVVLFP